MRQTFLFILLAICYTFGADDDDLGKKTADLKRQAVRIMKLSGKKVDPDKFKPTEDPTWDDIQMTDDLYKSLKKNFDIEEAHQTGEGDRVASPDFDLIPLKRWDMPVSYTLTGVYDEALKDTVRAGLSELESKTCIRFSEVEEAWGPHVEYVEVNVPNICGDSPLGRQPEKNQIRLVCKNYGTPLHETLHTLGFHHTQTRYDADQYVYVNFDNINKDFDFNFKPWNEARTDQGDYDYGSIMHYSKTAFALDSSVNTMEALVDPDVNTPLMGQRKQLSDMDVQEINRIYCSDDGGNQNWDVHAAKAKKNPTPAGGKKNAKEHVCLDEKYSCLEWLEDGICDNSNYTAQEDCPVACGTCKPKLDSKSHCADLNEHCKSWSEKGFCDTSKTKSHEYMAKYCKLSCGFCYDKNTTSDSHACVTVYADKKMGGEHKKVCGRHGFIGNELKHGASSWNKCTCDKEDCLVLSWNNVFAGHLTINKGKEADHVNSSKSLIVSCVSKNDCINAYEYKDFRGKMHKFCGAVDNVGKDFDSVMSSWNNCTCSSGKNCLVIGYDKPKFEGLFWYSETNATWLGPTASKRISSLVVSCY